MHMTYLICTWRLTLFLGVSELWTGRKMVQEKISIFLHLTLAISSHKTFPALTIKLFIHAVLMCL
jgi:hypothetical protein